MCSQAYDVSENPGQILTTVKTEQTILRIIIASIPLYVARWVGQNKAQLAIEILRNVKLVRLRQISEFGVLNAVYGSHGFHELSHNSPLLFSKCRRRGRFTLLYNIF